MWRAVRQVVTGFVALTLVATWATAEEKKKEKAAPLSAAAFVKKASYINMDEMALGALAARRAARADIRAYGDLLYKNHHKANQELTQLAARNNWIIAGTPDEKEAALAGRLEKLQGEEFDREFLKDMAKGHKQAIQLYETQIKEGKDSAVKSYAEKTLPMLRNHLKDAEKLQGKTGKGKENTSGKGAEK